MAAKAPAKKAAPKKANVQASKSKAKTSYTPAQNKAYQAAAKSAVAKAVVASRAAAVRARAVQNAKGVQQRRALNAARSKARFNRSGKRVRPASGKQAVIRLRSRAAQAAGYARRTQVYTYQQAAFISGLATVAANRRAVARMLARKKLKPKPVPKKAATPRHPSKYAAIGARAGAAAAARVSPKVKLPPAKKPASKTRKAAGERHETLASTQWITAGNDQSVENCVAVAIANHLLLQTGFRLTDEQVECLAYRDSVAKSLNHVDYYDLWPGVSLSEYGQVMPPENAEPGDIVGFEVMVDGRKADHCAVLMPEGKVISWGEIVPLESEIDEAWQVTWIVTSQ